MDGGQTATFCSLRRGRGRVAEVRRADGLLPEDADPLRMAGRGASALTAVSPFPCHISTDRARCYKVWLVKRVEGKQAGAETLFHNRDGSPRLPAPPFLS